MSRINTNVPALVAQTSLARSHRDLTISLQRLSSGLRINRGADDPAGLIASESLPRKLARHIVARFRLCMEPRVEIICNSDVPIEETKRPSVWLRRQHL